MDRAWGSLRMPLPQSSPELSFLDFYFLGCRENHFYEMSADIVVDFSARNGVADTMIREMFGVFENFRQSMQCGCQLCTTAVTSQRFVAKTFLMNKAVYDKMATEVPTKLFFFFFFTSGFRIGQENRS